MKRSNPIMILGCTSDAGKSLVVTAICRLLANRGVNVAPFKAQNMSNNAAITSDGLEIGRAQYLQAIAAKLRPSVLMNPILLKPSSDNFSQVIVNGVVDHELTQMAWGARKHLLWPKVKRALKELQNQHEQIVIEGAGSPAEINLRKGDVVNMSVALECHADVYLVVDIDKGGAFAHLLGTYLCLSEIEKKRVKGFVLNKFRGDPALLGNAMDWLEEKTGVKTVANLPYYHHHLPEEDSFRLNTKWQKEAINIGLVYYPYASNLDEFDALIYQTHINLVPIKKCEDLSLFDGIILPGSKNSGCSLAFLNKTGLDNEIKAFKKTGKPIVGVCGGLQILGNEIVDPLNLENGDMNALQLINLTTHLSSEKTTKQRTITWQNEPLKGYEIHHGETIVGDGVDLFLQQGLGWQQDNIFCTYLHGVFDNANFYNWFIKQVGAQGSGIDWHEHIDSELDKLANMFDQHGWL